ncbi:hypothetical protein [Streptacidiphilus sp. EB129]|uniref:hypothetical protein n=1 Tax=Streptacidiphilus sp. EB129 TaxID=3156262 RepID=UPI003517FFF7
MASPSTNGIATGALLLLGLLAAPSTAWAADSAALPVGPAGSTGGSQPSTSLQDPQVLPAVGGLSGATGYAVAPLKTLRLDPFAASSADPLSNAVALQPDGKGSPPVSTAAVTSPLSDGGGVASLPLVNRVDGVIPG